MANGHGGARKGAGRKATAEENKTREMARAAIAKKYGTIEDGMIALLETNEPSLVKFVWEHAAGKPTDKVDLTARVEETRVIDIDDNGEETDDFNDDDTDDEITDDEN